MTKTVQNVRFLYMAYGCQKVDIKFNSSHLTHYGGVYFFHLFLKKLGLRPLLSRKISYNQRNSHYSISEMIYSIIYPIILGLSRIEITILLGRNGVFKHLIGLNKFPGPTTLRRFLVRGAPELLPQIVNLHDQLRLYFLGLIVPEKRLVIDLDSTVCTVYGNQEGAERGYNPDHRGRKSYHPLFCFEYFSGESLFGNLRSGNVYTLTGSHELLEKVLDNLSARTYRMRIRGDSGFYDKQIIALLSQNSAEFAIVAAMTNRLKNEVFGLRYKRFNQIYSFSEFFYQPIGWTKRCRFCVIRKKLPKEELAQSTLFTLDRYSYSAIATNLKMASQNVWRFYNQRVQCERNIRGLKEDYFLGNIPTKNFAANEFYLELLLLSYDLIKWFQRLCLPDAWQNKTLQTLRNELLLLPGSFVQHGSKQILRFPKNSPQQKIFLSAKEKISKLRDLNQYLKEDFY